jgi:hypothetical protein
LIVSDTAWMLPVVAKRCRAVSSVRGSRNSCCARRQGLDGAAVLAGVLGQHAGALGYRQQLVLEQRCSRMTCRPL